jgi:hypothetical protein
MNTKHPDIPWLDVITFRANQEKFPTEELWKHINHHIAWSWDGSRIVASGKDRKEVEQQLEAGGIPPDRVVWDYVDDPNVSNL